MIKGATRRDVATIEASIVSSNGMVNAIIVGPGDFSARCYAKWRNGESHAFYRHCASAATCIVAPIAAAAFAAGQHYSTSYCYRDHAEDD